MAVYRKSTTRHFLALSVLMLFFTGIIWSVEISRAETNDELQAVFSYLAPRPDAEHVSTQSAIIVRTRNLASRHQNSEISFTVKGSQSGFIAGKTVLAEDRRTVLFYPGKPFRSGEQINVTIDYGNSKYQYDFSTSKPIQIETDPVVFDWNEQAHDAKTGTISDSAAPRYMTAPGDLPTFDVTKGTGSPAAGYIFLSYFDYFTVGRTKAYLLILDNNGEPVYYNPLPGIPATMDFKKQLNGQLTYYVTLQKHLRFYALDSSYQSAGSYEAGNGYTADLHDLQVLENGNSLVLIYNRRIVDMSEHGGNPKATVVDCIVQEIDPAKNVIFEWRSWDHIDITDTIQPLDTDVIRYIHCNSVEHDLDGNLLLSNRNLNEITKISRENGEILWRLGGKNSNFKFTNDLGFTVQHDARRLPNGNISVYDNGNYNIPRISRGVEYILDTTNDPWTATRVAEYRTLPDTFAEAMGNMQKQDNGNVVVGWGRSSTPMFTEFSNDGKKVLEFNALEGTGSYRVFRFPWQGFPTWPPLLVTQVDGKFVHLYFSWNGSTETASYQLFGGQNRNNLQHLATVPRTGFETTYDHTVPTEGLWYFQVIPVDKKGQPSQSSNLAPVVIGGNPLFLPVLAAN